MAGKSTTTEGARIVVRDTYQAQYSDPIAFRAGDAVRVYRADPEYPEWYWCSGPGGKEGWVHEAYLSHRAGVATAREDYSARELNVRAGEYGRVVRMLGGWAYVELDDGRVGWVPERLIENAV